MLTEKLGMVRLSPVGGYGRQESGMLQRLQPYCELTS